MLKSKLSLGIESNVEHERHKPECSPIGKKPLIRNRKGKQDNAFMGNLLSALYG